MNGLLLTFIIVLTIFTGAYVVASIDVHNEMKREKEWKEKHQRWLNEIEKTNELINKTLYENA